MISVSDQDLRAIVNRVVRRTMGLSGSSEPVANGKQPIETTPRPIPSPAPVPVPVPATQTEATNPGKIVAIGSDHGGYDLKEILKKDLSEMGYTVNDVGPGSRDACDYPDYAHAVAHQVALGKAWRGVMIDGAGIGSCMVGNKVPGVRAALAYDLSTAINSREHNDANMLTLGAGLIGNNLARQILKTFLDTEHAGGRHAKRVEKIRAVERMYLLQG